MAIVIRIENVKPIRKKIIIIKLIFGIDLAIKKIDAKKNEKLINIHEPAKNTDFPKQAIYKIEDNSAGQQYKLLNIPASQKSNEDFWHFDKITEQLTSDQKNIPLAHYFIYALLVLFIADLLVFIIRAKYF